MRSAVIMPQMGESIAEGTVVKWHKKPGDKVQRDEELFEISTDKVESVIPSPKSGFLAEILVGPGKKVPVDTVVAYLVDSAEELGGGSAPVASAAPATAAAAAPVVMSAAPAAAVVVGKDASAEELRRVRSTPLVRKIAAEKGVSLQQVAGTGLSGRVTKKDILSFLEKAPAAPVAVAEVAVGGATAVQYAPSVTVHAPNVPVGPNDRVEIMSVMRQSIADHMVMSRRVSAHCQTVHECDVTRIEKLREKYKDAYAQRGAKLSFTVFLTKAVADALRTFPLMNASLSGDKIIYHGDVNVGVAVALESGLIVPNVKRADELSMVGLAKAVGDMSERARTKKLKPEDVQQGTFSISNAGIFGSLFGVPIISQPNVGILGVGGIKKRVVVIDDEDNIAVRKMVYFCLTFDHRLIDGSTADGFMNKIKDTLQNFPEGLL